MTSGPATPSTSKDPLSPTREADWFERLPSAAWRYYAHSREIQGNAAWAREFGWTRARVGDANWSRTIQVDDAEAVHAGCRDACVNHNRALRFFARDTSGVFRLLLGQAGPAGEGSDTSLAVFVPAPELDAEQPSVGPTGFPDQSRMGTWQHDLRSQATYWSPQMYLLYNRDAAAGPPGRDEYFELLHPDDRLAARTAHDRLGRQGEPFAIELRTNPQRGPERCLTATIHGIRDARGELMILAGTVLDMTQYKRAEEAFQQSQAFSLAITEASPFILYVFDVTTMQARFVNRHVFDTLGYSPNEIEDWGTDILPVLMHPEDLQRIGSLMARWEFAQDDDVLETEFRMRHKNGDYRWLIGRDKVFRRAGDGRVVEIIGSAQDVTERKEANQKLREREAELAHMSRVSSMGEMATALAHEINQPLGAAANYAGGCLELLERSPLDREALSDGLRRSREQILRTGQIVQRLKSFVAKTNPKRTSVTINSTIVETRELLQAELQRNGIQLDLDLAPHVPPLLADRVQLQQVLVNLVRNAVEAGPLNTGELKVTVKSHVRDGEILVEVIDLGPGIPAEQRDKVFERYFTTKSGGMGMGLSISRSIVNAHGGRLWAEANAPRGTRFVMSLPCVESES